MVLTILECTKKSDKHREGHVIHELLKMLAPDFVRYREFQNKNTLLDYFLERSHDDTPFIHLSGHGNVFGKDDAVFQLPRGEIHSREFPHECFEGQVVSLSACELGKTAFIRPFMDRTDAEIVIAPLHEVEFIDAAIFFLNFYYLIFRHQTTPITAFNKTKQSPIGKKIGGAFQYWQK